MIRWEPLVEPGPVPSAVNESGNLVLPTGYYLDNFRTVLDFVDGLYGDILNESERVFSQTFKRLSPNAQRLYVRLVSRKGPHFRAEKVRYPEIDVTGAAVELAASGFLAIDDYQYASAWFELLNKPELERVIQKRPELLQITIKPGSLKKAALLALLQDVVDAETQREFFSTCGPFYTPLQSEVLLVYRLLFFGNLGQDLTEFVLLDLGLLRYESYGLHSQDRFFDSRKTVEDTLAYTAARVALAEALDADEPECVFRIIEQLPDPSGDTRLTRRHARLLNKAGRYFERKAIAGQGISDPEMMAQAIFCYERSGLPPARERLTRIHDRAGSCERALSLCQAILADPHDPMETMFAEQFQVKIKKKLGLEFLPIIRRRHPVRKLVLERVAGEKTEETVLKGLAAAGVTGFYAENMFWRGLFGLAFWDIIFMPVKGAFFNAYQRGPRGLFSPGFRQERRAAIDARLAEIREETDWPSSVLGVYDRKFGIANYLVAWSFLTKERVERVLHAFQRAHLADIFDRLSQDLGTFKTGFPDLIIFPDGDCGYELAEVKGPMDQLQPNQHRWLRFLSQREIPYCIIRVAWQESEGGP